MPCHGTVRTQVCRHQIPAVVKVEHLSETTTRDTFVRESDEETTLRQKMERELGAVDE